ncbi:hypothetical protein NPIL_444151 [Nephila pilipes]|uniref:Uncharacterized protein n=1 Tax=Nephila pilipes TaxID=299642 RepID=A0A8X6P9M3_NEPPI|nr:hypothetical protein NPIL_444151 [Nephila pilipes]
MPPCKRCFWRIDCRLAHVSIMPSTFYQIFIRPPHHRPWSVGIIPLVHHFSRDYDICSLPASCHPITSQRAVSPSSEGLVLVHFPNTINYVATSPRGMFGLAVLKWFLQGEPTCRAMDASMSPQYFTASFSL